jgi:hypothetical protein
MAKSGGRILRIIGTAESDGAKHKVAGEPVILVGDTDNIKGTKGDTGATGPAWEPVVDTGVTLDIAGGPTGAIDLGDGNFIPVYAEDQS